MIHDRRTTLALLASLGAAGLAPRLAAQAARRSPKGTPFSWELLTRRAQALSRQPFRARPAVPGTAGLGFDEVGALTYRAEATIAGGIRLFPVHMFAPEAVAINVVEKGAARPIPFDPAAFASRSDAKALGIAGFRAMTASGTSDWMAFQGASYFRAAGSQDQYGLSARALAVNTGIAGAEEFPAFTEFWIEQAGDRAYTIHALLDGPSVTGAFRFLCRHTEAGVGQDVASLLFLRRDVQRLGIAPATSMFWYGEGNRAAGVDWRPEIHDSDGLAMWTGTGERIWRPLINPQVERLNSFTDRDPKGFGLMQRDRRFPDYQDDGAFYEKRPNLWIEPRGAWGAGAVTLYEFPTRDETVDNVVAFWVPEAPAKAGQHLAFNYRLTWTSNDLSAGTAALAVDSFRGLAGRPGGPQPAGTQKLVVDFVGSDLAGLTRASGVEVSVDVARGRAVAKAAYPVVGQKNRWRTTIDVAADKPGPADVRFFLSRGGTALTETVLTQVS